MAMTSVAGESPLPPRCHARRDAESLPHNVNVEGIHAFGNSALMCDQFTRRETGKSTLWWMWM